MLSLLRLERKSKNSWNPFRIRIFLFLSYSFGIETINTFIHSVVPSKTIPDSRPKWAKCVPVFRPKRRKNPTRWGGTYLYSLYRGVSPRVFTALPSLSKYPREVVSCRDFILRFVATFWVMSLVGIYPGRASFFIAVPHTVSNHKNIA